MSIYTRMMGTEEPSISAHTFFAVLQEWMLGEMTAANAAAYLGLSTAEQTEATEIRDRITSIAHATPAVQRSARVAKALEMENVMILARAGAPGLTDPAAVRTRVLK